MTTTRISSLNPNLYLVGLYIQENALNGYKLVEGYPMMLGYQYETQMEKEDEAEDTPVAKKQGRPAKQAS